MVSRLFTVLGTPESRFFFDGARFDFSGLSAFFRRAEAEGTPVMCLSTALGLLAFLDRARSEKLSFKLPALSRLMETGGSKGHRRRISREALYEQVQQVLGIPPDRCVNEYGMTEMSSQFYDDMLRCTLLGRRSSSCAKRVPPWVHTRVVDPESGGEVPVGSEGVLCHFDLANVGTVMALETEDMGVRTAEGFEITGRIPSSGLRGCSLVAEEALYV